MHMEDIAKIKQAFLKGLGGAKDRAALEALRVEYLGRKGKLTLILRSLGGMVLEEKKKIGPAAQALRKEFEELLSNHEAVAKEGASAPHAAIDLTAPGRRFSRGHLHPLTQVEDEIRRIFASMNFSVVEGPEVESEYYNFDALNIPAGHPARDMWDTFWISRGAKKSTENLLLRTHTSPVQIRYMEAHEPPFQIIVPGRTFRYEATDASHEINFDQLEGLVVGKSITLANFKFVVEAFFEKFFKGRKIEFRYRPSYFPFVEPGIEVDIKIAGGKWLEIMGAGMVHPRVFEYAHYNPHEWQGFAFGIGIDRLAMIKYRVPDIRLFYSGDLRFINQF